MTNHRDPGNLAGRRPLRLWPAALAAALIVSAAVAGLALTRTRPGERDQPPPAAQANTPVTEPRRDAAREAALARLDRADAACRRARDGEFAGLEQFLADAKGRTPAFADRVLGWDATRALVADALGGGHDHTDLVRRAFTELVLAPGDLETRLGAAADGYLDAVQQAEDVLLAELRADLPALPTALPLATPDRQALGESLGRTVAGAVGDARRGMAGDVARELVAVVAGEVLARATLRLGAGATSLTTLGAGLLAAVAVDRVIALAWDGRGRLVGELDRRLDGLRLQALEGTAGAPGLRGVLEGFDRDRAARRRAAVLGLLGEQGGAP
jgi:hypothetical protein